ncbi:unnamed protein product [Nippostrongylus brasiliensis]|uniref:Acyl_transf_3 domain-containing protein n=1 Tax=Nippostrongylus brasiliensis TaxID=27835 RepID=A0A0N4Y295_NIPBR|nr:unnamed protein product [Nippostrongylus brasiliensis]
MHQKRPDIQGVRGWSIILVMLFHVFPKYFITGYVGVDIFFVVSGFLVASILHRNDFITHNTILNFYYRRIKRIMPLYFLTIGASIVAMHIFLPSSYRDVNAGFAKRAFLLMANIKEKNMELDYAFTLSQQHRIGTLLVRTTMTVSSTFHVACGNSLVESSHIYLLIGINEKMGKECKSFVCVPSCGAVGRSKAPVNRLTPIV